MNLTPQIRNQGNNYMKSMMPFDGVENKAFNAL
jgi:hypothetical protein